MTVGGAAVAPAAGLDDVLGQLAAEAKEAGERGPQAIASAVGFLFEPVAVEWLRRADPATPLGVFAAGREGGPTVGDIKVGPRGDRQVAPFKEHTGENDRGIDAVATMTSGSLAAIQIKTGDGQLTLENLNGFLGQATVDCGERTYEYAVLIYTNGKGIAVHAAETLSKHSKMLLIDGDRFEAAVPEGGWQKLLDDTKEDRVALLRGRQRGRGPGSVETGGTPSDDAGDDDDDGYDGYEAPRPRRRVSWEESKAAATAAATAAARRQSAKANGATTNQSDAKRSRQQHDALPGQLAALNLNQAGLVQELDDTVVQPAEAYEGDPDADPADRAAWLTLAARQTVLYEYHSAAADAVNRRRKITMSVLRDDHGFVAKVLARLITVFTPAARMAEVRAAAAEKAADKGKDFDPDSVDTIITGTRVQQMALEGAEIRGTNNEKKKKSGRPKQPKERRLATAYQQLVAMKATDPDRYDRIIALLAADAGEEA